MSAGKALKINRAQAKRMAAERAAFNRDLKGVRNAYSIPPETWEEWDTDIIGIARQQLALYSDLAETVAVPTGIEKTDYVWFTGEGGFHVEHTMDFEPPVKTGGTEVERHSVAIPIQRSQFGWGYRESLNITDRFDGQIAQEDREGAAYEVMNSLEDMCLYGPKIGTIRVGEGLLNYSKRITGTFGRAAVNGSALKGATGQDWNNAFYFGMEDLRRQERGGNPNVTLYINDGDWLYANSQPYDTSGGLGGTSIAGFVSSMVPRIVVVPKLPADNLLFVTKERKTVALPRAMTPAVRPRERLDIRDPYQFVVESVASIAPKCDADDKCGIVHLTAGARNGGLSG